MRLLFVLCSAFVYKLRGNHYFLFRATEESIALSRNRLPGWLIDWLIGLDILFETATFWKASELLAANPPAVMWL